MSSDASHEDSVQFNSKNFVYPQEVIKDFDIDAVVLNSVGFVDRRRHLEHAILQVSLNDQSIIQEK